jgi:DNA repair exonuclease SbcCD ATPase subunit
MIRHGISPLRSMKKIYIKIKGLAVIIAALLVSTTIFSQAVSTDSIAILKQQKETLELSKQINERKLKLAKLENTVEEKTRDMDKATMEAQKSANTNAQAATNLSNDSQDKKLARRAKKDAKEAKSDSKHARIATNNLDDLKKDIESLKNKIAADEAKLALMPAAGGSPAPLKE